MDRHATLLLAVMAVQLYSATDEVWSMLADMDDATSHLQTMSTNAVGVLSTVLTAMCSVRLRRVRGSLDRVERTLQPGPVDGHDWPTERRARAWLVAAVAAFGYLKYAQLIESDDDKRSFTAAGKALLRTMSAAGNYYVSVMFIDHVLLAKRVLYKLNVQITDTLGSASASFLAGFTVSKARLAYLDICDACTTVTRMFQTQLFVNIVGNVFGITFLMLSAFNTLMSDGTDTIRTTLYFLYDSLIRTLQMYYIIDACHTTVEQANFINITFQKKINEYYQINFTKRKVQLFILEMLDHKIEFIIYGFIYLDFEMFVSIMGTIATYLLILVQLGSSPNVNNSLNETTTSTTTLDGISTIDSNYLKS